MSHSPSGTSRFFQRSFVEGDARAGGPRLDVYDDATDAAAEEEAAAAAAASAV